VTDGQPYGCTKQQDEHNKRKRSGDETSGECQRADSWEPARKQKWHPSERSTVEQHHGSADDGVTR
jgi:hypothetical protein